MRRIEKVILSIVAIGLFVFAAKALYAQAGSLSPADIHAAEKKYGWAGSARLMANSLDLHSGEDTFSDGARGVKLYFTDESGVGAPLGTFRNRGERELHDVNCRASAIVVARELSAQSILSTKKDKIFTLHQFQIIDSFKSSSDAEIGKQIAVMRFGGEVMDNGELLRVQVTNEVPFHTGETYLLVLDRDVQNPTSYFFSPDTVTIPVKNGRIYPSNGSWGPFSSGELLKKIHERTKEIAAMEPCK